METSYIKKHEKLNIEEKEMKEKLQNEVTKIKEELEKHLSEYNQMIRENEKLLKGIKIINKDKQK